MRVNEYYDLFDVKNTNGTISINPFDGLPTDIRDTQQTNPFRGFSNWADFNAANTQNTQQITGKNKSSQALNSLKILENGDILCYPPNVSVPYWSKIIFRNYDYLIQPHQVSGTDSKYKDHVLNYVNSYEQTTLPTFYKDLDASVPIPADLWKKDDSGASAFPAPFTGEDFTNIYGSSYISRIYDFSKVPLFLKFDQYQSRTKVIFSQCDKTRNPDIEFNFGYHHGQMEPVKLNLSLSAGIPLTDLTTPTTRYNENLNMADIERLLVKCYWCIEWVYIPEKGN